MRVALRLLPLLALAAAFGVSAGHDWAGPADLARALGGADDLRTRLLLEWRLPRVLAAGLVGAMLGLGGAIFQGVFRNPLAEPYLLGSAGGAAIGATIALLVPLGIPSALALGGLSFAGAWGATALVLTVAGGTSMRAAAADTAGLLLAGVAVAAMLGAVRSFLMLALSDESLSLQVVLSWTLGGIQTPTWGGLALLAGLSALAVALSLTLARGLDLLGLGEEQARAFGLDGAAFVRRAVLVGAGIVALAVAYGGLVAFVGLVAPHLARWLVGPRHRRLLGVSAAIGAVLVMVCDGLARAMLPPAEIPLGLITAAAGGPFFLILLRRRTRP